MARADITASAPSGDSELFSSFVASRTDNKQTADRRNYNLLFVFSYPHYEGGTAQPNVTFTQWDDVTIEEKYLR